MSHLKRGDIIFEEISGYGLHVQQGKRPYVVVQNEVGNENSPNTIVCPITLSYKTLLPTHAIVPSLDGGISVVLCEQVRTVTVDPTWQVVATLDAFAIRKVDKALYNTFFYQRKKEAK